VKYQPATAIYHFELADALLATREPAGAAVHFAEAAKAQPGNASAWYGLGNAYTAMARIYFADLERTAPQSGYWFALLARSQAESRENGSAFYFYRQALEKQSSLHGVHAGLAELYRRTGHADWAAVEDGRETEVAPPDCRTISDECRFNSGDFQAILKNRAANTAATLYWKSRAASELAAQAYDRVLSLPPSAASHRLKADIFRLQKHYAESAAELQQALELSPRDFGIRLDMARTERMNQDHAAAVRILSELLAIQPDSTEANYLMGDSLLALEEPVKAVPYLEEAAARPSAPADIHAAMGRAYLQSDQPAKAIPYLKTACATDREGNLCYLLAQACTRAGKSDDAAAALRKRQQLADAARARAAENDARYRISAP
jgi:tetratricopeptide (TPR) repeat protein